MTSIDAPGVEPARRQALLDASYWSMVGVPIVVKGKVVGLAELYHSSSQALFSETDLDRSLAVMASWRNAFPTDLSWDAPECLEALGRDLLAATAAAWCTLLAYELEAGRLRVLYETGQAVWPIGRGESHRLDDTSLRRIALMERTAVAAGLSDPHTSDADRAALPNIDQGMMLVAPLMAHGEAIGIVQLIDIDSRRVFTENELSLAQAIANVVGSALDNGRLYSALSRRAAQLEAAYNDLRDADRTTDEMIQNISHELRTPLAPIIGYTDMLLAEDLGPLTEDQRRVLEIIGTQSRLLTRMVADILIVQNVPQEPLHLRTGSLSRIADSAIQSITLEASKHRIEFITDFPDDLPDLPLDEERILQVFESLLDNAVKFSPKGGTVLVAVKDVGHSLQVDIVDQGVGVPQEEHQKIWRRFYQVDGSTTRSYNGLGLGLTIVKQVVERHEGRAWVTSEPGKGSTFSFTLPKREWTAEMELS
jgi:signal transduction histidine kinase